MWVCITVRVCLCVPVGPCVHRLEVGLLCRMMQAYFCVTGCPLLPQELESPQCPSPSAAPRLRELPVHRVPVFPEPTWCLAQRKCQHVEEGGAGRTSWGRRTGCREPWASPAPRRVGVSPRPQGCNALRPHQAEPHVRLQTHFSGFCFREPTSQSSVARPEGEVPASRLPGRLCTRG